MGLGTRRPPIISRRKALYGFVASAANVLLWGDACAVPRVRVAGAKATPASTEGAAANSVTPFALPDVRLEDGPFRRAQSLDERYLLQLDPDRLLHGFRVNAGLVPKAPVYGGWESEETWAEIRCQGHTLGHYLSACALMFASSGQPDFKRRVEHIVGELGACQEATGSGLVCAFPDGAQQLRNSVNGGNVQGVPWYTMHKIFAGLRDAHAHCASKPALKTLVRLSEWTWNLVHELPDAEWDRMLELEHGGMNEVLADVYDLTGEEKYLTLARKFCHRALLTPMAAGRDVLDGLHANTQIPKVIGFKRIHELTGELEHLRAAQFFWHTVVSRRSFVIGGVGDVERFFPPRQFAAHLGSAKTMETCCAHNQLRLTRALFQHDPSATYADYTERVLYNSILGSQDPVSGMMTYFQPTRPGYLKLYCTPTRSFWCCTGTGMENHAKYGDSIYFRDAGSLYVNLFISSVVTWREKGVTLRQVTDFPESAATRVTVAAPTPTEFTLKFRHPRWCDELTVHVNGHRSMVSRSSGRYIELKRRWRMGDVVDIELPMHVYSEELPGHPTILALLYGPMALAGRFGTEGIPPGEDLIANERTYGEVLDRPIDIPAWLGRPQNFPASVVASREGSLTFRARGFERGKVLELVPYYRIAHERYNLYWTVREPGSGV
jgi:uncharacterized protein